MYQPLLVHVVDAGAHLDEEVEGCVLAQILLLPDKIEKVSFACILQCEINGLFVLETCVQTTNVLVIELFLNSDLAD